MYGCSGTRKVHILRSIQVQVTGLTYTKCTVCSYFHKSYNRNLPSGLSSRTRTCRGVRSQALHRYTLNTSTDTIKGAFAWAWWRTTRRRRTNPNGELHHTHNKNRANTQTVVKKGRTKPTNQILIISKHRTRWTTHVFQLRGEAGKLCLRLRHLHPPFLVLGAPRVGIRRHLHQQERLRVVNDPQTEVSANTAKIGFKAMVHMFGAG